MSNAVPRVDVGILTFREDELAAVLGELPPERILDGRRMYNICRVQLDGGDSYTVAVVRCLEELGSGDGAQAARDIIEDLAPSLLLLVGVGGMSPSDKVTLGDVVVATRILDGNRSDVFAQSRPNTSLNMFPLHNHVARWVANLPAHAPTMAGWNNVTHLGPSPELDASDAYELRIGPTPYGMDDNTRRLLGSQFSNGKKSRQARAVTGAIVATDFAVSSSQLAGVHQRAEGAIAVEGETLGSYRVAQTHDVPTASICGIGEVVGLQRQAAWVSYACKVAASFAHALLKTRPIAPKKPSSVERSDPEQLKRTSLSLTTTFFVSRLTLREVRAFRTVDQPFTFSAREDEGQWILLLGANGVGKTTMLRAMALALSPADVSHAVLSRMGPISPTVRAGSASAVITLQTPSGDLPRLTIQSHEGGERLAERGLGDVPLPFVVAYGSRRGSGLASSGRGTEFTALAAVESLFDEGANLIQPDAWLKEWKLAALEGKEDSPDARFFEAILATLCTLLPDVEHIHVSREAVEVEGPTIGRVLLGALSDGYRTTMGWILDMIARWVEEAKRRNIPVDKDFHEKMTGVAIIDEIDLHLHPRWQREVIEMVRTQFRRMSFIVTTHNPLTLLGAEPGEIYVMSRPEHGDVEIVQKDLPPGVDAEQVLTGEWFGLASTLDDATLDLLAEHQKRILEKGIEAPESAEVEAELRLRLGTYASTSIERLALEAAAKIGTKNVARLSVVERREVQDQIAALLQEGSPTPKKPRTAKAKAPAPAKSKARRNGRSAS